VTVALAGGPKDEIFVGRQAELAGFVDVMARVRQGQPWLVTIEGESGIGKTPLVRRSLASVPGFGILSARADPAESDLDYGIVEQLSRVSMPASSISTHCLAATVPDLHRLRWERSCWP
jgi:AAA ATPase domain